MQDINAAILQFDQVWEDKKKKLLGNQTPIE
jgi:hypothetical protein